jgi:transcriptional regulator with XRE-family HTH domain
MRSILRLFGARLRKLRTERGLSAAEVAAAVDCDRSSIYNIENGRHAPSFQRLMALAEVLQVDEMDLLTFPGAHVRHDLNELSRGLPVRVALEMKAACERVLTEEQQAKGRKPKASAK